MAIDTHKYADRVEHKPRHSALEEFGRDERKPAVLLLSALVLSALFFGLGLLVGRWTATPSSIPPTQATPAPTAQPTASPAGVASPAASPAGDQRQKNMRRGQ